MPRIKGEVRRSQLITTYGIGSLVALAEESFMVTGIDRWNVDDDTVIHEPRLERELNVGRFHVPPAGEHTDDVPVIRFPKYYSCPTCNRVDEFRWLAAQGKSECTSCAVPLVPSRFVICCENGHIDEFPYFRWLHSGQEPGDNKKHRMTIEAAGKTASLKDIVLTCSCGVQPTTMEGAFGRFAMQNAGVRCAGNRPWLDQKGEPCDQTPRALQRGASNVWYSVVRSALSIPPWSEGAYKAVNKAWKILKAVPDVALKETIETLNLQTEPGYTIDDLVLAVQQRKRAESGDDGAPAPLKEQEYEALCKGKEEFSRTQDFVCERTDSSALSEFFPQVMLVKRLREVRALEAFTRVTPWTPGDKQGRRGDLFAAHPGWLPAIEVTGEGVFLRLDEKRLASWEDRHAVQQRAARVDTNYRKRFVDGEPDREITPRFLLVHSLAHSLINQWSLDSGYPAASLRERLYVSGEMAGLLIYTATTDSAGSLGGVTAQAEPARLAPMLKEAVRAAAWCSSDPLCIEAEAAGVDALNLGACHACMLLPETSCEEMNLLLDRAMLIGSADSPDVGFFAELLTD